MTDDRLALARGCAWAIALSIPLWLAIGWVGYGIVRAIGAIDG